MPELPEIETIVRGLSSRLIGLEIEFYRFFCLKIMKNRNTSALQELKGRKILSIRRRGKLILIDCEGNLSLLFHLKMTGQLLLYPRQEPLDKHTHFILTFKGEEQGLRFRDVRKFGFISCIQTSDALHIDELRFLGPEPLEIDFPHFLKLFQGRRAYLKRLLLDQSFIAGIGNIYADEILFQAKFHPLSPASCLCREDLKRLWEATRNVLKKALASKGSSIRNYRDIDGQQGSFQNYHQVYGRESLPCPLCGEKIKRLRLGARSSFYCPSCQNLRDPQK